MHPPLRATQHSGVIGGRSDAISIGCATRPVISAGAELFSIGRRMHSTGFCVEWPVSDCRGLSDLPQRCLFPVAGPMPGAAVAHGVKAWLMLSVVVAAADDQLAFGPNDLRAH